jgi:hypothetical protein
MEAAELMAPAAALTLAAREFESIFRYFGIAIAASTATIAITTISSISVKPVSQGVRGSFFSIRSLAEYKMLLL